MYSIYYYVAFAVLATALHLFYKRAFLPKIHHNQIARLTELRSRLWFERAMPSADSDSEADADALDSCISWQIANQGDIGFRSLRVPQGRYVTARGVIASPNLEAIRKEAGKCLRSSILLNTEFLLAALLPFVLVIALFSKALAIAAPSAPRPSPKPTQGPIPKRHESARTL